MKVTQMPSVHAANLVVNNGNTAYGVDVIEHYLRDGKNECTWDCIFFTKSIDFERWRAAQIA